MDRPSRSRPRCIPTAATMAATRRVTRRAKKIRCAPASTMRLLYRHWTSWSEGKRLHLFVVPAAGGAARDLLPGANYDVPPPQREGPHPIAFAPDNRTICFTAVTDRVEATSTNGDLFEIDAVTAGATPKRLTTGPGFDGAPAYSPDGRTIAFRSQARAGLRIGQVAAHAARSRIRTADQPDRCLRSQCRGCAVVDRRQVDLLQRRGSGPDAGVRDRFDAAAQSKAAMPRAITGGHVRRRIRHRRGCARRRAQQRVVTHRVVSGESNHRRGDHR